MPLFLGIDVGTSGVKALLMDEAGAVVGGATAPLTMQTPHPGWAEQDPDEWWAACRVAIRSALGNAKLTGDDIAAVGLSGQMHSSVLLDRGGDVVRPALLWCDGRTTEECAEITRTVGQAKLRRRASNPALEGFTLPKLLWVRRHESAAWARVAKVLLPKDYVRFRLSGALVTEPSDASATLMYDTPRRRWSEEILSAFDLPLALLPEVGGSAEVTSYISTEGAQQTGLRAGTPIVGGGADNACGAVGVGAVVAGEAVASWGTSGTVLAPTTSPVVDPGMRAHTFCHVVPDTWYVMGVMLSAGGAFSWYREWAAAELAEVPDRDALLDAEAARAPIGALGIAFLPYLQGERTPHRDAAARGAFIGLSLAHKREHMTRAVLEGITFGMRDSLEVLRGMGLPLARMLLTGGGARSPLLRQMQADVYGLPVVRVNREEGPAFGAALLGAVGARAFPSIRTACKRTLQRLPAERPNRAARRAYESPYERWKTLYPALRGHFS